MTSKRLLDPVSVALLEAADYIEEHGHCKNMLHTDGGQVCAIGALCAVADFTILFSASDRVRSFLNLGHELHFNPVVTWNNAPERTKEEVISAFREAAMMGEPSTVVKARQPVDA